MSGSSRKPSAFPTSISSPSTSARRVGVSSAIGAKQAFAVVRRNFHGSMENALDPLIARRSHSRPKESLLSSQPRRKQRQLSTTAPALISTTSAMPPGVAVSTEKAAPWAMVAGEAVMTGRGLKK